MPEALSDEDVGLVPLTDEDVGLKQLAKGELARQTLEARIEGQQAKALSALTDIGTEAAKGVVRAFSHVDPTGFSQGLMNQYGVTPTRVIPPETILPDIQTVSQFAREGLGNLGIDANVVLPEQYRKPVEEFAAENIAALPEMAPLVAAGTVAPKPVARVFQSQMLQGVPQAVYQAATAETPEERIKAGLGAAAGLAFPAAIELGLRERPTPIPDIPGIRLEQPRGALPPRAEPVPPIERVTPEQAAVAAEKMTAPFEEQEIKSSIITPNERQTIPELDIKTTEQRRIETYGERYIRESGPEAARKRIEHLNQRTEEELANHPIDQNAIRRLQQEAQNIANALDKLPSEPSILAPEKTEVAPVEKPVETEVAKPETQPLTDEQVGLTAGKLEKEFEIPADIDKPIIRKGQKFVVGETLLEFTGKVDKHGRHEFYELDKRGKPKRRYGRAATEDFPRHMVEQMATEDKYQPPSPSNPMGGGQPTSKPVETPVEGVGKAEKIPVWKVSYTDLETRSAKRPFFNLTVYSEGKTRQEAIQRVKDYHGNPSRYGEFRASKAPEGTKAQYQFEAPKPEQTPPKMVGMGGATPSEFTAQTPMQSAIKNAAVDRDRIDRGEAPMMDALRKSDPDLWAQAMNIVDQDGAAADKLIARHKANPFIPTDVETMVLLHRRVDLKNEFNKANREAVLAEKEGRGDAAEAAKAVRDSMGDKLNELDAIMGKGDTAMGTMAGRAFRARQLVMNEDFSMAELVTNREADLGRKLTADEMAQLQKISDENARLNNEFAALLEAHEKNQAAADMRKAIADSEAREKQLPYHPRILELAEGYAKKWDERGKQALADLKAMFGSGEKPMFSGAPLPPEAIDKLIIYGTSKIVRGAVDAAKWTDAMLRDLGPGFAQHAKAIWEASKKAFDKDVSEAFKKQGAATVQKVKGALKNTEFGTENILKKIQRKVDESKGTLPDIKYYLDKLLDFYVRQGMKEEGPLLDAIHADLRKVIPDITRRETREILAGYGSFKPLSKDAVSVIKRDMHGQWQEISKIDMIQRGIFPPKLQERATMSDKQRWLRKQYEEQKRLHPEVTPTDAESQLKTALQSAKTRITNQITDLEHQIQTRTKIVKESKRLKPDAELERLMAIRDEMKAVYDTVFKKPELTDAERLEIWKERTKDRIAELTEKVKNKDFQPKKRPDPIRLDPEAIKINFELHKVHRALLDLRLKDQLDKRNVIQKIGGAAANLIRFSRAVITGGEFSAVLRQGAFTAGSHPIISAKAIWPMLKALWSEENQFKIMEQILTRENAPLYQRAKLELTETGMRLSNMEEHYMFRVSEKMRKIPGVGKLIKTTEAFQRAYTTYLNLIRADTFDALANVYGKDIQTAKDIANLINVSTGRGSVSLGKYATGLNTVLFAPRYSISRFQLLLGQPFWTAANKRMIVNEYAKAFAGAATVYTLGMLAGASIETDPRSSDFGKIKVGNTRIDPMAGLNQVAVLLSKFASGQKKTAKGKIEPLVGPKKFGQQDIQELLSDFGMNKLAPLPSTIIKLRQGHDQIGQPYGLGNVVVDTVTPITYRDIYDTMKQQGIPETAIISTLAIFGMGVQNYQQQKTNSSKF